MSYFNHIAEELIHELIPNARIKRFLKNSDVIGAYAEATVMKLVRRMVEPLKISTGAVISPELCSSSINIPQIDVIIWQPNPFPAIFSEDSFGLIPRQSSLGILEIKRSSYTGIGDKMYDILSREQELTSDARFQADNGAMMHSSLGIVCIFEKKHSDKKLDELIQQKRVVVLSELNGHGDISPIVEGVMTLVNFLASLRKKAKLADGNISIAYKPSGFHDE